MCVKVCVYIYDDMHDDLKTNFIFELYVHVHIYMSRRMELYVHVHIYIYQKEWTVCACAFVKVERKNIKDWVF